MKRIFFRRKVFSQVWFGFQLRENGFLYPNELEITLFKVAFLFPLKRINNPRFRIFVGKV